MSQQLTVSEWCERAAAMLRAGLGPDRVHAFLGEPPAHAQITPAVRIAWAVSLHSGSPLGAVLEASATAAQEWERIAADRAVAIAGPRLAARVILAVPLAGLALAGAIGVHPERILIGSLLGLCCLASGTALLVLGNSWSRRLIRAAEQGEIAPGFNSMLVAELLRAGLPVSHAIRVVDAAWPAGAAQRDACLALANHSGMPPARALHAGAAHERSAAARRSRSLAAALAVKLTVPLGVCVLPAFIALAVVPLVLSVAATVVQQPIVVPSKGEPP